MKDLESLSGELAVVLWKASKGAGNIGGCVRWTGRRNRFSVRKRAEVPLRHRSSRRYDKVITHKRRQRDSVTDSLDLCKSWQVIIYPRDDFPDLWDNNRRSDQAIAANIVTLLSISSALKLQSPASHHFLISSSF
jgi:hypothetical protein